jgi:hypothetical protein
MKRRRISLRVGGLPLIKACEIDFQLGVSDIDGLARAHHDIACEISLLTRNQK